ncbi:hypothetical protein C2845_PM15G25600 [Panicum miliaceum]|uniref:Secreted protein n=1 Tax=Panicum miliaceum TaxID=4540 RepID=A0A3L6QAL2_PANMI|nr:hypothetical protein C2845_PM15G25600 [Panicum miliaceum]
MTVRSACSARRRFSSSAFLLAAAAAALTLPESTDDPAVLPPLAIDADDEADCALSLTDLPVLSRTACAARAPTRLMYLKLIALLFSSHTKRNHRRLLAFFFLVGFVD